ncbi:MAG: ABC transporter substrate-binding protein [Flavobacteriaceae bacterium]|nr:ABC transporter substrate-binding protein [Flavobacteriaceae bacterium]
MRKLLLLTLSIFIVACTSNSKNASEEASEKAKKSIEYASGFTIEDRSGYQVLTITNPWPGAETQFRYALVSDSADFDIDEQFDAIVKVPVSNLVVTSTTHIPSLDMLGVSNSVSGFPNLDYISSEVMRKRVAQGLVTELGKNESINTEVLIELAPDAVITFAVEGSNKTVKTIQKTGIPVLYNADWTETHPLGKAEWIKFFGALFQKNEEADSIFRTIEKNYQNAKKLAATAPQRPTVLSGAMYKDVWYLPQGDSWAAQFIDDANANYLWAGTKGTGSLSLNLESVLEKGKTADFWIAPGQFESLRQLQEAHPVYGQFNAFQEQNVYNYTFRKGPTGGVIYYELAPNRPDLVMKDLIAIFHPQLLPSHDLYFFSILK